MGITYRVNSDAGLFYIRHTGTIAFEEFREFYVALRTDPAFSRDTLLLVELGGSVHTISSSEFMRFGASRDSMVLPKRTAVVAPSVAEFGVARMFALGTDRPNYPVNVFRDRAAALEWLGLSADAIPASWEDATRG
jgi:hypothetical protein